MKSTKMERILVIDDDVELCTLVGEYLQAEGFVVDCVHDGESGLQRATGGGHLLIVLDVMLPGINGFEVLRRIRATSRMPVLLLTARGEDVDRIVGLEIGADDYLPKPLIQGNWWPVFVQSCDVRALISRFHPRRTSFALERSNSIRQLAAFAAMVSWSTSPRWNLISWKCCYVKPAEWFRESVW